MSQLAESSSPRGVGEMEAAQALAAALSEIELKYKFSLSPHPSANSMIRVVFSRPTFQAPESPTFVCLDLSVTSASDNGDYVYKGAVEGHRWPIELRVTANKIHKFSEAYIDMVWDQKMALQQQKLWM